ncbi:histone deacetylase family protein [Aureimonas sp. AU12]|uniref:histone deacetylase family protein n=1 Tax=Aureimonas sp. AU12 TaxID=1638161 RepID=UPI0007861A39|nr:histone deacetylase family protein [Aureimonas sp. AU12]
MKLFFSPDQLRHRPTQYGVHGRLVRPLENPDRAQTLTDTLGRLGLAAHEPADHGLAPILAVHADHYVEFLRTAFAEFTALPNAGPEVLPNVHPYAAGVAGLGARGRPRTTGILGRTGWYIGDLSCAMTEGTYAAAYASAQTAASAALDVAGGARASFALCRPPGHHAYVDRASGFCFFNNAAIAAQVLRSRFARVAILDFDTHHGDGTQAIFYARPDVLVASTHTDPSAYYPHYFGYAEERGEAEGDGFNLNVPLAFGSDDTAFTSAVGTLVDAVAAFGAEALVVSAGWDAHHADPLSKLAVTTPAYGAIAERIAGLGLPTVIVQEGGYSLEAVAEAAPLFTQRFVAGHR